ncbi:MAG: hypothetical protein HY517_00640 [Candidatus Aenigmarchaeota archaeon]|nr:hypothetical protein [Candidatus Aenigmarchaeota archaeon]
MKNKSKVLAFAFIIVAAASPAFALGAQSFGSQPDFQDATLTNQEAELAGSLPEPGLLPDHPFYFVKQIGERIRLLIASDEERPALHLNFAKLRLAEAKRLAEQNKSIEKPLDDFNAELNETGKFPRMKKEAAELAGRSAIVLAQVMEKVPAPAKPAIGRALNNSIEKHIEIRAELENKTTAEIRSEIKEMQKEERKSVEIQIHKGRRKTVAIESDLDTSAPAGNSGPSGGSGSASLPPVTSQLPAVSTILPYS